MPTVGKLTRSRLAHTMPVHADPLSFTSASFRGVNQVTFSYRTNTSSLPSALELHRPTETYPLGA